MKKTLASLFITLALGLSITQAYDYKPGDKIELKNHMFPECAAFIEIMAAKSKADNDAKKTRAYDQLYLIVMKGAQIKAGISQKSFEKSRRKYSAQLNKELGDNYSNLPAMSKKYNVLCGVIARVSMNAVNKK